MNESRLPTVYVGIESANGDHGNPEDQLRRLEQHQATQADRRFHVGKFSKSGHSGFKGERGPELVAAIELAKAAAAEHCESQLGVFHSSRLARVRERERR